jgi:C1A family cysteine protease
LPKKLIRVNRDNHSALLVGYDSRKGVDYWLVQNSCGKDWGDEGFFLMKRNPVRDFAYYSTIHNM